MLKPNQPFYFIAFVHSSAKINLSTLSYQNHVHSGIHTSKPVLIQLDNQFFPLQNIIFIPHHAFTFLILARDRDKTIRAKLAIN